MMDSSTEMCASEPKKCRRNSHRATQNETHVAELGVDAFQSRSLQAAICSRLAEEPNKCVQDQVLENIARGEMLRLLPFEVQARIFSYISVKERVRVLETISGGTAAEQRTQANFRRAVLESYKSVTTINKLGPQYTKLKFIQTTGERLEGLKRRFPKLTVEIDGSELQGFIFASRCCYTDTSDLRITHLSGRDSFNQIAIESDLFQSNDAFLFAFPSDTSALIMQSDSKTVYSLNLIDLSVKHCAPLLYQHEEGDALMIGGFAYAVGGGESGSDTISKICERYNLDTDTWDRIADLNHGRAVFTLFEWNDSLYAVGGLDSGGTVERYDPEKNAWEVVFQETRLEETAVTTAVVVDGVLYCGIMRDEDTFCSFWKFNMRTGTSMGKIADVDEEILSTIAGVDEADFPFDDHLYVTKNNVLQRLTFRFDNASKNSVNWTTYMLDRSECTWRLLDTGALQLNSHGTKGMLFAVPIFL